MDKMRYLGISQETLNSVSNIIVPLLEKFRGKKIEKLKYGNVSHYQKQDDVT